MASRRSRSRSSTRKVRSNKKRSSSRNSRRKMSGGGKKVNAFLLGIF